MSKQTVIFVSFQMEGFHRWEDAPKEVEFLRHNHRHMFHFEVEKQVSHHDRDIEIILFKRKVEAYLKNKYTYIDTDTKQITIEFGQKSCEMLANEIIDEFGCCRVKVTEDGENGAVVLHNYKLLS